MAHLDKSSIQAINMIDIYKVNQNFKFNSYNLHNETRVWYLNGIRTYHNISIWFTIASSSNKEELIVWADMNNIKIEKDEDEDEFKKYCNSREDMEN